ncbi:MAG: hypothetical protein KKF39_02655 [Nanoarchaeota archaeon]|nr:hypothetical protein [Nanoarchaeota archaeon]
MNNTINNRLSFRIGDVITGTATIKTNRDGTKDLCSLNGFCNSQGLEAVKYHKIFKPLE